VFSFETQEIGCVSVIRCAGRIVVGEPCDSLRAHVTYLLRDRHALVLHLGEVDFIDSSGLGTIVRLLTATRQVHGDLKLCAVPPFLQSLFKITSTRSLFDIHESHENAVIAFYRSTKPEATMVYDGPAVLCVHKSSDILAYLRELLHHAGYNVQTTSAVHDALLLLRVTHPRLLVLGHEVGSSVERKRAIESACTNIPCIVLPEDFSRQHAGEAASAFLIEVRSLLPVAPHLT
jgi:anti-sigma B factor antagonist